MSVCVRRNRLQLNLFLLNDGQERSKTEFIYSYYKIYKTTGVMFTKNKTADVRKNDELI